MEEKDLAASVALGRAGIQHALTAASALRAGDAERSRALRGKAKAMAYNVASFTWPGWDEQGIDCTPTLVAMGFDAARTNLRLAIELERGELARSRALWMLAGHLICRGELAAARETYIAARDSAAAAKSVPEMRLSDAFAALTQVLQNPAEQAVAAALEAAKHQLRRLEEHGAEFLRQLETAQRIFAVPTMSANHAV